MKGFSCQKITFDYYYHFVLVLFRKAVDILKYETFTKIMVSYMDKPFLLIITDINLAYFNCVPFGRIIMSNHLQNGESFICNIYVIILNFRLIL